MTLHDDTDVGEWLARVEDGDETVIDWEFPNETIKSAYLDGIADRNDEEVRDLLRRFLISTGSLGADRHTQEWLIRQQIHAPESFAEALRIEHFRRLLNVDGTEPPPWEGLTWVLDLLPQAPGRAIEVVHSYLLAHVMALPDGRITGLADAQSVIRAMWIGNPRSAEEKRVAVMNLGPERFEYLIDALYDAMGFATTITPRTRDGGHDLKARRAVPGSREYTLVECKLWNARVDIDRARILLAVVHHERATKGALVAPGGFTADAGRFAAEEQTLELIDWPLLLPMLDEHLGANWLLDVDRIILDRMRHAGRG